MAGAPAFSGPTMYMTSGAGRIEPFMIAGFYGGHVGHAWARVFCTSFACMGGVLSSSKQTKKSIMDTHRVRFEAKHCGIFRNWELKA